MCVRVCGVLRCPCCPFPSLLPCRPVPLVPLKRRSPKEDTWGWGGGLLFGSEGGEWAGMHWKVRDLGGGPRSGWTGGWMRLPKRLGGGYCRLHMPLKLALAVRGTVAGRRLGALEGRGGIPPSNAPRGLRYVPLPLVGKPCRQYPPDTQKQCSARRTYRALLAPPSSPHIPTTHPRHTQVP